MEVLLVFTLGFNALASYNKKREYVEFGLTSGGEDSGQSRREWRKMKIIDGSCLDMYFERRAMKRPEYLASGVYTKSVGQEVPPWPSLQLVICPTTAAHCSPHFCLLMRAASLSD